LFSLLFASMYGQAYTFPVRPGEEAWKTLGNTEKRYAACQLPNEILKSMTTTDLVATCLDYPLIGTLFAYNDVQTGFNAIAKGFNGIEELLTRKDAGTALMEVYAKMAPENYDKNWSDVKKGDFSFQFSYIETFLAQRSFQATLTLNEKKELVKRCMATYTAKQKHSTIFGTHGTSVTGWTMARTMENSPIVLDSTGETALAENMFMEQGTVIDFAVVENSIKNAKNFIK